jgi:hypothetical protein
MLGLGAVTESSTDKERRAAAKLGVPPHGIQQSFQECRHARFMGVVEATHLKPGP